MFGEVIVPRYTFVTVIYEDDYPAMALQACTMHMFLPLEMVERIIIIDNSSEENIFNVDPILPHYGSLGACVTIIRRRDLTPINIAGWHTQQLLKLEVAKRLSTCASELNTRSEKARRPGSCPAAERRLHCGSVRCAQSCNRQRTQS